MGSAKAVGHARIVRLTCQLGFVFALVFAAPAWGEAADPAPTAEPNWSEVRSYSEARLKATLIDPDSANIIWTSGFQWASVKRPLNRRNWGWVGCGVVNSRNRMGGYAGRTAFYVIWDGGFKEGFGDFAQYQDFAAKTCERLGRVPLQTAFTEAERVPQSNGSAADELLKFAELLQKGLISQEEFEAQKKRLLKTE